MGMSDRLLSLVTTSNIDVISSDVTTATVAHPSEQSPIDSLAATANDRLSYGPQNHFKKNKKITNNKTELQNVKDELAKVDLAITRVGLEITEAEKMAKSTIPGLLRKEKNKLLEQPTRNNGTCVRCSGLCR